MNEESEAIETTGPVYDTLYFKLPNGKTIHIGKYDLDFFLKLRKLPAETKIEMMLLTEAELETHLKNKRKSVRDELITLFSQNWHWRETGDPYDFEDLDTNENVFGLRKTKTEILKDLKKNKLTILMMYVMIDWFKSDREVSLQEIEKLDEPTHNTNE
jgi:hypothetical protein